MLVYRRVSHLYFGGEKTDSDLYARQISAQTLPRDLRLLVYGATHKEVDMSGAHYEPLWSFHNSPAPSAPWDLCVAFCRPQLLRGATTSIDHRNHGKSKGAHPLNATFSPQEIRPC